MILWFENLEASLRENAAGNFLQLTSWQAQMTAFASASSARR
jgi:hypothetical protein